MSKINKLLYLFVTILFFVIFDQYLSELILKSSDNLPLNSILEIVFVPNTGAAFNIFDGSKIFLIAFALFAVCLLLWNIYKYILKITVIELFFLGMLIAGIFSNMYERMVFGYVRDYICLKFTNFPVFNISDILINIGVFIIVFIIIKNNYSKNNENNN